MMIQCNTIQGENMFELKRQGRIKEQLKVGDDVLTIEIDTGRIMSDYRKAQDKLALAQQKAQSGNQEALAQFGEAIVDLMVLLFGEENAVTIIDFYDQNYPEMLLEVMPFIQQVIQPKLEEAVKDMAKRARKQYRAGRR